jgi:class 3 adenylate cyclase
VNIAARIEEFAQVGGMSISKTVHDLVGSYTKSELQDMGIQQIKNTSFHAFDLGKA